ncbi:MAG TPA: glycosyltransferase family A protein [Flexivirga sp.]|uniref:glycosyltransferase n=1 Tax=Flexivirga sp. TaxID=1962927 RepID=UPI002B8C6967|nr:glycosyltransferase family A protein [Flexivirga sp.]HWC23431.1 glycosyltransferase family A protein [Flexivirga sp.]
MPEPLVTIVIPTYNDAPHHLAEAIASVHVQSYPHVELIVVDDGSDVPVQVDGVRVIRQQNAGVSAARNSGIRSGTGEFVICLDGDDRLSANFAAEAVDVLVDPQVTIASPAVQRFGAGSGRWADSGKSFTLPDFGNRSPVAVASAFRRTDWEKAGGYDEDPAMRSGHEDHEWWIRLLGRCGGRAQPMPTAVLHYRIRPDSRFHGGDLAYAERVTRERIVANNDPATVEALLWGAWSHSDRVEKQLERARSSNVRAWVWRARKRVRKSVRVAR